MKKLGKFLDVTLSPLADIFIILPIKVFKVALVIAYWGLYLASIYYSLVSIMLIYMVWTDKVALGDWWEYILLGIACFGARAWAKHLLR